MTPLVMMVLALATCALVGAAFVAGTPILAVPIVFVVLAGWGAARLLLRARDPREARRASAEPSAHEVEFTDRDRETLEPSPDQRQRRRSRQRAARAAGRR